MSRGGPAPHLLDGRVLDGARTLLEANGGGALLGMTATDQSEDIAALAKGHGTNVPGFVLRLGARIPLLFIAGLMSGA